MHASDFTSHWHSQFNPLSAKLLGGNTAAGSKFQRFAGPQKTMQESGIRCSGFR